MTPELLRSAGEVLYGDRWQGAFSSEFELNARTLRRWLSGQDEIPVSIAGDIFLKIRDREKAIRRILDRIEATCSMEPTS